MATSYFALSPLLTCISFASGMKNKRKIKSSSGVVSVLNVGRDITQHTFALCILYKFSDERHFSLRKRERLFKAILLSKDYDGNFYGGSNSSYQSDTTMFVTKGVSFQPHEAREERKKKINPQRRSPMTNAKIRLTKKIPRHEPLA